MTNHAIADELFEGEYKDIRAAYREGEGNATIRAECQREVSRAMRCYSLSFVGSKPPRLEPYFVAASDRHSGRRFPDGSAVPLAVKGKQEFSEENLPSTKDRNGALTCCSDFSLTFGSTTPWFSSLLPSSSCWMAVSLALLRVRAKNTWTEQRPGQGGLCGQPHRLQLHRLARDARHRGVHHQARRRGAVHGRHVLRGGYLGPARLAAAEQVGGCLYSSCTVFDPSFSLMYSPT